ncbi:LysM and BON domain-containing protein [Phenylobacterium sp.]|jgi:nucleoid-associated protein YgaU|uniref:LysM and BON domain-containing protein n=1 Tax=Phenylobacterium sp. TaxID=1871053 RepID=UPI002E3760E0|nr:LysM and BON domain-containing protein [Phenylobacterium sp.]HEX2559289.1 LysM and BON domain-containing protein [Phenylobacterium sp.]
MGLFDFAREAGKSLRGGKEDKIEATELAEALRAQGVTIANGQITVRGGDTVSISGQADSQREKELAVLILGNTKGVAHVEDNITVVQRQAPRPAQATQPAQAAQPAQPAQPAQAAEPPATFYTVKSGDTLSKIAQQFLGSANRYNEIFEANRPMLKDPDEIYPGQTLRIPKSTMH